MMIDAGGDLTLTSSSYRIRCRFRRRPVIIGDRGLEIAIVAERHSHRQPAVELRTREDVVGRQRKRSLSGTASAHRRAEAVSYVVQSEALGVVV